MKTIRTEEAVGHVICHDITQIIPGREKGPLFRKGHIVTAEDIPALLALGKEHLYVYELHEGFCHEDEAAARMAALCAGENICCSEVKEGKIELKAAVDGCLRVDSEKLRQINSIPELMIAARRGNGAVCAGDIVAGTRVIPLIIAEEKLALAEKIACGQPIMHIMPYRLKTAALIITGSEIQKGLIQDRFYDSLSARLAHYQIRVIYSETPGDEPADIAAAIKRAKVLKPDIICCTGGMSVDPDDNTPGAVRQSGARIVRYGVPVLPGAMFLLGYFKDQKPILGLPGCVMHAKATVFDLVMPRIAAGIELTKDDLVDLGEGGLCLGCRSCTYPQCAFGK